MTIPRSCRLYWPIVLLAVGCNSIQGIGPDAGRSDKYRSPLSLDTAESATDSLQRALKNITETKTDNDAGDRDPWQWVSAISLDVPRAEVIPATVETDSVARVLGSDTILQDNAVQIRAVDGRPVRDYGELDSVVEECLDQADEVEITLLGYSEASDSAEARLDVAPADLLALSQAIAPDHDVTRHEESGSPRILIRDGPVRCRLLAQVERPRGLLLLVVSISKCWGSQVLLPGEIHASCDGQSLRCLTTADTLEVLYGRQEALAGEGEPSNSFAAVSEKDDYLAPTNFQRLEREYEETYRDSVVSPPGAALATVTGATYPGSAVLGDARALNAFLLQRRLYEPGDSGHTGWVLFGGEELCDGGELVITVQLGDRPKTVRFQVPAP